MTVDDSGLDVLMCKGELGALIESFLSLTLKDDITAIRWTFEVRCCLGTQVHIELQSKDKEQ